MQMSVIRLRFAAFALVSGMMGLMAAHSALAGALTVLPVRVEVAANQQFCSINIGNDDTKDITVQVRGYPWRQIDGADTLDETKGIAINPSIVTIPSGTRKLVRCSLPEQRGPGESTYRLIVSELPRADNEPGTLQTLLQLSIPIFRAQPDAKPELHWTAAENGRLIVSNDGLRHARIVDLIVRPTDAAPVRAKAGFYLLAGASRTVDVGMGTNDIGEVEAMIEDGSFLPVLPDRTPKP